MENDLKNNSKNKNAKYYIPLVLLIILIVVAFGGATLLFMYAIISAIAFKSAMVGLLLFSASFLLIALGLGCIVLFNNKVRYARLLGKISNKDKNTNNPPQKKGFKEYLTLSNVTFLILTFGVVLNIISAFLGCTDKATWVNTVADFKEDNGYFSKTQHPITQYPIHTLDSDIYRINFDLQDKIGVVVYRDDSEHADELVIETFTQYSMHVVISNSDGIITIDDNHSPKKDNALNDMMFFVFSDSSIERQVIVYIPSAYEDDIEIVGENIIFVHE